MRNKFVCLLFAASFSLVSMAQDGDISGTTPNAPARTITMYKMTDQIYMFEGKGGNIGIQIGEDGVLMIDSQFAEAIPEIVQLVQTLSDKPIQFLVNTHHHGDHTGGNKNMIFKGTIVYSHDNVRTRLVNQALLEESKEDNANFEKQMEKLREDGNKEIAESKAKARVEEQAKLRPKETAFPLITFSDNITFHYNGETIMVFHVHNAHTDGDALVYFTESNILHTGDVFLNGKYPFIDTKSGGNYEGYIKALGQVLGMIDDETKIIPGHGLIATKADVDFTHRMMKALLDRVSFQYISGKSREEVMAMKNLSEEYDAKGFGAGFIATERFIGLIYDHAKKKYGKLDRTK